MPVKVDKDIARRILQEEALRAQREAAPGSWKECVENLSRACEEARIRSHVAVFGNAILAKATNLDVDPFSLKARDDSAGAYSARGIADKVLGPWATQVGLNIGVSGPYPLNNQPFFHAARVSLRLEGVKGGARRPLEVLCEALTLVSRIRNERDARRCPAGFHSGPASTECGSPVLRILRRSRRRPAPRTYRGHHQLREGRLRRRQAGAGGCRRTSRCLIRSRKGHHQAGQ